MIMSALMRVTDHKGGKMNNIIVLKCGGSIIDSLSNAFFANIQALKKSGLHPVIVHGGGPAIKAMLEKLHIESKFESGLRVTTKQTMEVVEMVLAGKVNKAITQRFNDEGVTAVGLSGSDARLLSAEAIDYERFGYVGEIVDVNTELITKLLDHDIVPIIAPIAIGKKGVRYNVNADTVAGVVANRLLAKQLVFITDVPGIMKDDQLVESATNDEIKQFIERGIIYGGMIPKVQAAIDSLSNERQEVVISNGQQLFAQSGQGLVGTIVKKSVGVV